MKLRPAQRHYVAIQYTIFQPNRSINTESTGRISFTSLRKVWMSLGCYFCRTSCTEFHEKPTNNLVSATRLQADGRMDMVSTQDFNILTRREAWNVRSPCPLWMTPFRFLTQWRGLYHFNGSFHECWGTVGHPLTKISNKNLAETRNCEVGLALAPRTFTSWNAGWLQSLEKCGTFFTVSFLQKVK
jgi:hypothetical protein